MDNGHFSLLEDLYILSRLPEESAYGTQPYENFPVTSHRGSEEDSYVFVLT